MTWIFCDFVLCMFIKNVSFMFSMCATTTAKPLNYGNRNSDIDLEGGKWEWEASWIAMHMHVSQ